MKLFKKVALSAAVIGTLGVSSLSAHALWVNSFESFTHAPGHTMVGLGWGHTIPLDDIMNSPNGKVNVEQFSVTSPDGTVTKLQTPTSVIKDPTHTTGNFDVYSADVALQKVAFKKDSKQGVYKIEATTKPTVYTKYLDTKDRVRLKLKTLDKIDNIKKVFMSVKYQAFAKSYLTLGEWSEQKSTGKGLEIIPKTDLSNVKVGDLVEFEILFYGKPLNTNASSMDFVTAKSNTFGQNDGFSLMSYISEGKAQFRMQSAGQWIIGINHKNEVTSEGPLKDLHGKVQQVFHGGSLTFNVKEK